MQFDPISLGIFVLGPAQCIGVLVLFALSACHSISLRIGGNVQKILTTVKLGVLAFILIGAFAKGGEPINLPGRRLLG